jgi:Protein of unknown function (DUF3574)
MKLKVIPAAAALAALLIGASLPAVAQQASPPAGFRGAAAAAADAERAYDDLRRLRCRQIDGGAEAFSRTELFFGLSRPGGVITEADFKSFVDVAVTPRFPDGLTVLSGVGQFRDSSGTIIVEGAKQMILLYPRGDRDAADKKIEQIRSDYKRAFQQQSVLRTDDVSCVSF